MAKYHKPRSGSTGYSPRVRAKKETPTVSNYAPSYEAVLQGFLAYKAGMTHILAKDLNKNSHTHNMDIQVPVTILDCPPLTVFGIRAYIKGYDGSEVLTDYFSEKLDKDLSRAMQVPKEVKNADKKKKIEESLEKITKIVLLVHTQPKKSGVGKKTPSVMELGIGGDVAAQWAYAQEQLGKDISVKDIFNESDLIDAIAVTKGKGFQGPVKRWGIKLQKRKASRGGHERHVGSVGGWKPANLSWLTPMAGQMGYFNRVDFNKFVVKVGEKGEDITPPGGFIGYGVVKGEYLLVMGSVPGPKKRAVALRKAIRPSKSVPSLAIDHISVVSQQGT
jgi:large subunit ribosomal protein L3